MNDSKYFVIEGDEYDSAFFDKRSKFLHYLPELLIVNNIEFDHADIFNNLDEIKLSFRRLLNIVPQNGMVLVNGDDPNCVEVARDCLAQMVEVGFSKNCAQRIRAVAYSTDGSRFTLGEETFEIPLVGEFNVRNAAMAVTAAGFYDVPKATIDRALRKFLGNRASPGIAGRSSRRKGNRRLRAPSHGDLENAAVVEAPVILVIGFGRFSNRGRTRPGARFSSMNCPKR